MVGEWKLCFVAALLLPVCSGLNGMLYPRETESREVKSLDGIWRFRASSDSNTGFEEKWFADGLEKNGPTIPMPVPSSYNDITEDKDLREHVGVVWYERTFFVPQSWKDDRLRVWIRFGSVHYLAHVWINGKAVAVHEIGHLPFQQEISTVLNYGGENRITVAVDNTLSSTTVPQGSVDRIQTSSGTKKVHQYSFDFFNYAGIHRSVVIYTTPRLYVEDITIFTDVLGTQGIVNFNITYAGAGETNGVSCLVDLVDAYGHTVARTMEKGIGPSSYIGKLEVPDAKLWWPYLMSPTPGYLYTLEVRLSSAQLGEEVEDVYRLPIGIRTIHWTNSSLLINNKPVYIRGFGRHEDSDIRGRGLDLALVTKDYNLLKWIGANAYRTSHYPYAEEIMDFADREGIIIIDECPSVDTDKFSKDLLKKHKDSLTELIQRDKNRPSVIMWSVANEPRSENWASSDYFRSVVNHVKKLDRSRPVTAALNVWYSGDRVGQYLDVIGINRYQGWYSDPGKIESIQVKIKSNVMNWYKRYNKPVLMTEYGAEAMIGLHILPEYIWSEEYQMALLSEHFKAFDNLRKNPFFIGEMIWNFADFKTDQSTSRVGGNRKGIFTRNRQPKGSAFHVRRRYWQLAQELDSSIIPSDLEMYTASVGSPQTFDISQTFEKGSEFINASTYYNQNSWS